MGYNGYNAGGEDFEDQLQELEAQLVENEGINRNEMDKNQKQLKRISEDIQSLSQDIRDIEEMGRKLELGSREYSSDIQQVYTYNQTQKNNIVTRQSELEALRAGAAAGAEKAAALDEVIAGLRDTCIHQKHIDPDNDDRVNYVIKDLEDQIQELRQRLFDSDETKWQTEMALSKVVTQLDKIFLAFNRTLVEVGEEVKLEPNTHSPQYVGQFLHKLNSQLKADVRNLQAQSAGLKRDLQCDAKDIQSLMVDREKVKESLDRRVREFRDLMSEKEDGHERLAGDLEVLRSALMAIQNDEAAGAKDLEQMDTQLSDLKSALSDKQKDFEKQKRSLRELVEKTVEALTLKRQKQLKILDAYIEENQRQAEEKINRIRHETKQIKGIANILPKPK